MKECMICGNKFNNYFEIIKSGKTYAFDCFECAIHKLAPTCSHAHAKSLVTGWIEAEERYYCCAHCAREDGFDGAKDNIRE